MLRLIKLLTIVGTLSLLTACFDGPPDDEGDGADLSNMSFSEIAPENAAECAVDSDNCQATSH